MNTQEDNVRVKIVSPTGKPQDTIVQLSNGKSLGRVQSVSWSISVGQVSKCHIETILDSSELSVLLSDTKVFIRPAYNYHPLKYLFDYYLIRIKGFFNI